MIRQRLAGVTVIAAVLHLCATPASAKELKVISDTTVSGFGHVESVAYDPRGKAFYASDFGPDLKSADKDGKGFISKLSMDGKVVEKRFFPAEGQTTDKAKPTAENGGIKPPSGGNSANLPSEGSAGKPSTPSTSSDASKAPPGGDPAKSSASASAQKS